MKFNVETIQRELDERGPEVGNVYPAQGNRPTAAWVVVAISEAGRTAYLLGIDQHGNVCSTSSYNFRALEDRPCIGRVDLSDLNLTIQACAGTGRAFRR